MTDYEREANEADATESLSQRLLPSPDQLAAERDPSKRVLALVEPATNLLVRATALTEANEIRSQAAAIERYARSIRLSREAIGAAQIIARRAEARIGELSGPRQRPPGKARSSATPDDLSRQRVAENRAIADNWPTVEDVLGELAPEGKATRAAVLRAVRHDVVNEGVELERRKLDNSPISEVLELQRALRVAAKALRAMKETNGQAFSAAPLAERVRDLCREVEGLLCHQ